MKQLISKNITMNFDAELKYNCTIYQIDFIDTLFLKISFNVLKLNILLDNCS